MVWSHHCQNEETANREEKGAAQVSVFLISIIKAGQYGGRTVINVNQITSCGRCVVSGRNISSSKWLQSLKKSLFFPFVFSLVIVPDLVVYKASVAQISCVLLPAASPTRCFSLKLCGYSSDPATSLVQFSTNLISFLGYLSKCEWNELYWLYLNTEEKLFHNNCIYHFITQNYL